MPRNALPSVHIIIPLPIATKATMINTNDPKKEMSFTKLKSDSAIILNF